MLLLDALRETSDRLALEVAVDVGANGRVVRRRIAGLSQVLEERIKRTTLDARGHAKALAGGQVAFELDRQATRREATAPAVPVVSSIDVDLFEAQRASGALSAAWASASDAHLRQWERAGGTEAALARELRAATERLLPRVESHAAWQAMEAYNRQHADAWDLLAGTGPVEVEPLLPDGWSANLFRLWSAVLDRKTCPVCHGLDGTMVPMGKKFHAGEAPLHIRCRCVVITIDIPDEKQLRKLPGITLDYAQLKDDIREHFRNSRLTDLTGLRHSESFVREALKTSSPEALTRRLSGRREAIRKRVRRPKIRPLQF